MRLLAPSVRAAVLQILEQVTEIEGSLLRDAVIYLRRGSLAPGLKWCGGVSVASFYVAMTRLEKSGQVRGRWSLTRPGRHGMRIRVYSLLRANPIAAANPMPPISTWRIPGPVIVAVLAVLLGAAA